jgi:transposase
MDSPSRVAGIDVGDRTHWVCVGDAPGDVREFPAHTPGLRQLVEWLRERDVQTVALEASGVYGRVLHLTLLEAGLRPLVTSPKFTRQIQGRPKTDKRDCQWIWRLHSLGMLPPIFEPDDATQTLRDLVRLRGNLVRLSGQHIQRMQKSLELMNLKLTAVVGDVTGVTGLKVIRAILDGVRDPLALAKLRDRRCKKTEAEIATALDGRYRIEHVTALRHHLRLWEEYGRSIAELDGEIEAHLRSMKRTSALPPLPPKPRVRGRKPHDPAFDVRTALYYCTGVDLTVIEGIDAIHALTLVSELGGDFTKWPTVKHFTSWLGLCPNFKQTGGQVKSSKTRKGKNRAAHALRLAAWGLMRSTSGLGCYLRRQRGRLGAPKAITATAHKLARIVYALVRYGGEYVKQSQDEYESANRERMERTLRKRAKELGYEVVKKPEAEACDVPLTV